MNDWKTYNSCAEWCARRGLKGDIGDPLPNLLSADVANLINGDPEAFKRRVRECAYALSMESVDGRVWDEGDSQASNEWDSKHD